MTRPALFALIAIVIAAAAVALWFERHPCLHFERMRVHHGATAELLLPKGDGTILFMPARAAFDSDEYFCTERR